MTTLPMTPTVTQRCGHEHVYDLAATTPLLRAVVVSHLAQRDCLSCRRVAHAEQQTRSEASDAFHDSKTVETSAAQSVVWERRARMPELDGTERATAGASRVRFTLISEAHDWCLDREWTEEEFTERIVALARQHLDAAWWIKHCGTAPEDLEDLLVLFEELPGLERDISEVER